MNPEKNIETRLEQLAQAISSGDSFVKGVMGRLETSSDNVQQPTFVRRLVMKTTFKFAAAAILLIAVFVSLALIDKTIAPAYAIEKTIAACHSLRFIHIRTTIPQQQEPIMIWAEFSDGGQPKSIRLNLPSWVRDDGAKEAIWKENIAQIWFKKYNGLLRVPEQGVAGCILQMVREHNPKTFMQTLLNEQENGFREIKIEQPSDTSSPIVISTVTLPDKDMKFILFVDQSTQLPFKSEVYLLKDGHYILECINELKDYNQPIDPRLFTFENLPADIIKIDQIANVIGLEQGQKTKNQVAIEVVRCFWQSIMNGDYDTAGQMMEGIPGSALKKMFEKNFNAKIINIVSVFPSDSTLTSQNQGVIVPCTFELEPEISAIRGVVISCTLETENEGQTTLKSFETIRVGPVYNQPGRWTIFGGL